VVGGEFITGEAVLVDDFHLLDDGQFARPCSLQKLSVVVSEGQANLEVPQP
jgi:hypothetical protein